MMNKKAKLQTKTWMWIILILAGALFLGGMYTQKQYPIFSVLPVGQTYSDSACTFISDTNIVQANNNIEGIEDFSSTYTSWIAVDWDGDGTKEGYGKSGTTSASADICSSKPGITHTPGGLKVVKHDTNEVGICSTDGKYVYRFTRASSSAQLAVLTCASSTCTPDNSCASSTCTGQTCTNNCGTVIAGTKNCVIACTLGEKQCLSEIRFNAYKECISSGWSGTLDCPGLQTCSNGHCVDIVASCTTFTQLQTYANQWVSGTITYRQLITYAISWSSCS